MRFAIPLLLLLTALVPRPATAGDEETRVIEGIPGPEDLVADGDRLLVSSQDRRAEQGAGALYAVDLATLEVTELPRLGEPEGLSFHPHGIDLVTGSDGMKRLYVISHRREGEGAPHAVCVYEVLPNGLSFLEMLEDPLMTSPNDLAALPDGGVYVTNDRAHPEKGWSEAILGKKIATVAYYDGAGDWSVAAEGLGMPNGIVADDDTVLVALTRENAVVRYSRGDGGVLTDREHVAKIKGPDNLSVVDGAVLVATHEKLVKFMAHSKNANKISPSRVYRIALGTGVVERIYDDDGSVISAASGAVQVGDQLYIAQVFEPFVLRTPAAP